MFPTKYSVTYNHEICLLTLILNLGNKLKFQFHCFCNSAWLICIP